MIPVTPEPEAPPQLPTPQPTLAKVAEVANQIEGLEIVEEEELKMADEASRG